MASVIVPKKKVNRQNMGTFQKMGLMPTLLRGIQSMGYKLPTPIQRKCIPLILDGHDVVAMARTGSGKSAAFLIPLISNLGEHSLRVGCRGLILSPTRELALQTAKFTKQLSKYTNLRICIIVGGESVEQQFDGLSYNPDIIIATPGRISYLLKEISSFNLRSIKYLIFDEADRLFEMGFAVQLKMITNNLSKTNQRQTMLFSATMPKTIVEFTRATLTNPIVVRLDTDIKISPNLQLSYLYCRSDDKLAVLLYLLRKLVEDNKLILIFAATRYHVELIEQFLKFNDLDCVPCYGSMEQQYRNLNINKFRKKQVNIMIVTDLASRGIDIPLLDYVINFQIPTSPKSFVHRVGRVARNGKAGIAISIVQHTELPYVADIYRFLGHPIPNTQSTQSIIQNEDEDQDENEDDNNDNNDHIEIDSDEEDEVLNEENDGVEMDDNGMITIQQHEDEEDEQDALFKTVKEDNAKHQQKDNIHPSLLFRDKVSFGMVPQHSLLAYIERVNDSFNKEDELEKLLSTCNKAMDIYNRTKLKPSKSGIQTAKEFNHHLIHPLFLNDISKKKLKTFEMLNNISTFKPHTTVFEMGGAANPNYHVMQHRRNMFNENMYGSDKQLSIKTKQQTMSNKREKKGKDMQSKRQDAINKYRDNEFFIETKSKESMNESFVDDMLMINNNDGDQLKKFIMELDEDERSAIDGKKKLYRYNPNTRKYVTEYMGDRINRFMNEKNEADKKINGSQHKYGKLYQEWKLKSKREIAINGSMEHKDMRINDNNNNNNKLIKNLGLRKHRHFVGSNEYFEKQRTQKRINAIRGDNLNKEKRKKEKIKKFKREKFRKWWSKNRDQVKKRKAKRRMRAY